jgi:hypothetical protein
VKVIDSNFARHNSGAIENILPAISADKAESTMRELGVTGG